MTALSVASYNIRKAIGRDGRRDPARILQIIAAMDADVVLLQEADKRFGGRDPIFSPQEIEAATGLTPRDIAPDAPGLGWHGNVLLLRPDIVLTDAHPILLPASEPRGAYIADLQTAVGSVRLIGAHFGLIPWQRRAQAAALVAHVPNDGTGLVAGDLNALRRGGSLSPLTKALTEIPLGATFPTRFPMISFDRIYHGHALNPTQSQVFDSPAARLASDHLPILARFEMSKQR